MNKPRQPRGAVPRIDIQRLLRVATCPSLSGKSQLTYHWGLDEEERLHLRIQANTGNGTFSEEWVPWSSIQALLTQHNGEEGVTSMALFPLFRGQSINTPSFVLAVLKAEGLLSANGKRSYRFDGAEEFQRRIEELRAGGVTEIPEPTPAKGSGKRGGGAKSTKRV